eukprot:gene7014-406_t
MESLPKRGVSASFLSRFLAEITPTPYQSELSPISTNADLEKSQNNNSRNEDSQSSNLFSSSNNCQQLTAQELCRQYIIPKTDGIGPYLDLLKQDKVLKEQDVGPANMFVSYARSSNIIEVVALLIDFQRENQQDKYFFWIDFFVLDYKSVDLSDSRDRYVRQLGFLINEIGQVLLILSPWNAPLALTCTWCIWELHCAARSQKAKLFVHQSTADQSALLDALKEDAGSMLDTVFKVDIKLSETSNPIDKKAIMSAASEMDNGFLKIGSSVETLLQSWLLNILENTLKKLESKNKSKTIEYARACNAIGDVCRAKGLYGLAKDNHEKCFLIEYEIFGENHPDSASTLNSIGNDLFEQGEYEKARSYYQKCLKIERLTMGDSHEDVADSYSNIGMCFLKMNDEEAIDYLSQCLKIRITAHGENHPEVITTLMKIGDAYTKFNQFKQAVNYYMQSLQSCGQVYSKDDATCLECLRKIGDAYHLGGDYQNAILYLEMLLTIQTTKSDQDFEDLLKVHCRLGQVYKEKNDYQRAIQHLMEALNIATASYATENNLEFVSVYLGLGGVYKEMDDNETAFRYFIKSLDTIKAINHFCSPEASQILYELGALCEKMADYEKALEYFKTAYELETSLEETKTSAHLILTSIASTYSSMQDYEKAIEYRKRFIDCIIAEFGSDSSMVVGAYIDLGQDYLDTNSYQEAIRVLKQALVVCELKGDIMAESMVDVYMDLGRAYEEAGSVAKSLEYFKKSLSTSQAVCGDNDRRTGNCHEMLAHVLYQAGKLKASLCHYQKALTIETETSMNAPFTFYLHQHIGNVYFNLGRFAEAATSFQEFLDACHSDDELAGEITIMATFRLGVSYMKIGQDGKASLAFQKVINCDSLGSDELQCKHKAQSYLDQLRSRH